MLKVTNQGQLFVHIARPPPGGCNCHVPRSAVTILSIHQPMGASPPYWPSAWPQAVGKTRDQEDQVLVPSGTYSPTNEAGWPMEQSREHVCLSPRDHSHGHLCAQHRGCPVP